MNNRVSDLKTFDDTMDAVGWGEIAYPDVNWRYMIMPSSPLPGDGKSFDPVCVEHVELCIKNGPEPMFNECIALQTQMKQMVAQGEADAKAAVENKRACDNDSASCKRSCSGLEHNIVRCSIDKVGSWLHQTPCKIYICIIAFGSVMNERKLSVHRIVTTGEWPSADDLLKLRSASSDRTRLG